MQIAKRAALVLSLLLLAASPAALAQGDQQADFSDEMLTQYVQAQQEVQTISEEYRGKLQNVEDRDQAMQLQEQANEEMVQAVTDIGLSVQDYNAITQAANQDEELRNRIEQIRGQ